MSEVSSISTVPIRCGCIVLDTSAPTATSDRPSDAALSASTTTAMYGSDAERLLETWPTPSSPVTAVTTSSVASCSVAESGAVTSISMSLEPNPPAALETVIVPASSSAATAAWTSSRRATWSASGSVVIEYVIPLPPPANASRSADPLEPIETCTVSMPSMSSRIASTSCDAAFSASRLGAAPMSCVMVKVF